MKKVLLIGLCLILLVGLLSGCGLISKAEPIEWDKLELGSLLPAADDLKGRVDYDSNTYLSITLYDVSKEQYKEYRDRCIEAGFNIEGEDDGISYESYNSDGYNLRLRFSSDKLYIYVDAPEEMDDFEWPKSGLGTMLPATDSLYGKIARNNSEYFIVRVGNMSTDAYSDYVEECEAEGFDVDFSKDSDYFSAKNTEGYKLTIRYLGFNIIEISLNAPEEPENNDTDDDDSDDNDKDSDTNNPGGNQNNSQGNNNTGMNADFKAAMDSYEQFMDEYVVFMKKYKQNPSDLGLLTEYATFMSKYAQFVEDFGKWQDEDLNTTELAYYIEVQSRVAKKLLEITQ